MFYYFWILDEAKMRQAELDREIENLRTRREALRGHKPGKLTKKLQTLLNSLI